MFPALLPRDLWTVSLQASPPSPALLGWLCRVRPSFRSGTQAPVSCLGSHCQPFRTPSQGRAPAPMALASAPSLSFLPFALPLLVLAVPCLLRTCPFILPPCLLRVVGCLPHPFLTPCPLSPHLSVRLSHRLRHSRTSSSVSTISVLSLLAPLATSSPVTHSLIFLSFKGSWLIQTASPHAGLVTQILWVTIFTQAAQKAKLSVNEVLAGASSSRPPRASLHRCPGSDDARALGPAGTWVPFCLKPSPQGAHSQHHPTVRRTLPFAKGRLQPQQLF